MSSVAHQPSQVLQGVLTRVRVAPLTLIVATSAAVRLATAWLRPTPDYFPDEYMYSAFARSLAAGHLPIVRGAPAHFFPLLQPLLTAPAWLLSTPEAGYRATQTIESVLMSLAAVPVYYLARRLDLPSRWALAAAGLSLAIPALVYSSFVLSEPVAYPLALAAVAAAVNAVDRPGVRSFALFLGVAALGMFARLQLAILLPCFVVALVAVLLRERRLRAFVRSHLVAIGLLVAVAGALLVLGPGRNTGYYPSFLSTPGFEAGPALGLIPADALVLAFAGGFVLVPGAILGLGYALVQPVRRVEFAFGVLTAALTVGVFAEAIVYGHPNYVGGRFVGHTDFVQERYLFYLLPLWTLAFLLYARRGWPRKALHALLAVALVVGSLRLPLAGNLVGDRIDHSPFLFAVARLAEVTSTTTASLAVVLAGTAAVLILVAVSFVAPRRATALALVLAGVATLAASAGAIALNVHYSRAVYNGILDGNPSAVDAAGTGPATMVLSTGSTDVDALLFWNPSIDRVALLPQVVRPDAFAVAQASIAGDGTLLVDGAPAAGDVLLSMPSAGVGLQNGVMLRSTPNAVFVRARNSLRFRYLIGGSYQDGWLSPSGSIAVWPTGSRIDGRLVLSIRPPRAGDTVEIRLSRAHARTVVQRVGAGRSAEIAVPLCARHPVEIAYRATPPRFLEDGRIVAARLDGARFVPGGGC